MERLFFAGWSTKGGVIMVPEQRAYWTKFYEGAWQLRTDQVRRMMAEGERHPYRLIKRLETLERRHFLVRKDGEFRWDRRFTGGELLPCGTAPSQPFSLRGESLFLPYHTTANLHRVILDFIDETGPYDCIIELGCGFGRNIFELWYEGGPADIPYYGGEYTNSGVELARELAALEPGLNATFFHCDHTALDLSAVPHCKRALLFTMHSIEQVKAISPAWFAEAASVADQVVGLNFEPFGYQVADLGSASKVHKQSAEMRGWNQNFAEALKAARDGGTITLDFLATELFLAAPENPTSLAVWRSRGGVKR